MKTRQKRLMTSVGALFVALIALAGAPAEAVVPSSGSSCRNAGGCATTCGGDECEEVGECSTSCTAICSGGLYWVGCEPDD
jgi:hypothetical protein